MRVQVINEITLHDESREYRLYFQWCLYVYDSVDKETSQSGTSQNGYRFIWKQNGKLKPARGQARLKSTDDIIALVSAAKTAGWGDNIG